MSSAPPAPHASPEVPPPALISRAVVRDKLPPLLKLAVPVVLAEMGWMSMGLVDTIMVGPLGPTAIGATGLGGSLFMAVAIFGMGLLLGLDTLVSQAHGAQRPEECARWLMTGLSLVVMIALPMTVLVRLAAGSLEQLGLHPDVQPLTRNYLGILSWSMLPLLCYAAFRRYLQGMSLVRPVTFALVSANLVNVAGNWVLIYGHLGVPALGVAGSAWATVFARIYMAFVLFVAALLHRRRTGTLLRHAAAGVSLARVRTLVALGLPAAVQISLEVGVFAASTALAGKLAPVSLASHQIALNVASFVFMVPLGMASASAVFVGQHVGRRDPLGAARAGWTSIVTIAAFMSVIALLFAVVPRVFLVGFSRDEAVLAIGTRLLLVAAVFQLFDGLQAVITGILRGVGDTRSPMLWNLFGHWGGGLPLGWTLCFPLGFGVVGLWIGLSFGLTFVAGALLIVWRRRVRHLLAHSLESPA